jgi:hypothetical protein
MAPASSDVRCSGRSETAGQTDDNNAMVNGKYTLYSIVKRKQAQYVVGCVLGGNGREKACRRCPYGIKYTA